METIKGDAYNLPSPVVGLLEKKRGFLRRTYEPSLLILREADSGILSKGRTHISSGPALKDVKKKNLPHIENISFQEMSLLKEGDIVVATPEGRIHIIYDSTSHHNCIFATNRCNLKCVMCPQPPSLEPDPSIDTQIAAIRLMAYHRPEHLAITGGEPTLLGFDLLRLINACKKHIPGTALVILTNGKIFKKFSFVKEIVELKHPNIQFAIPLYSDDYSIHDSIVGIRGSFFDTIKGLHNLALFGQRIEVRTVVLPQNSSRLVNLAEFIYKNLTFVSHIAFMGIEMIGAAKENADILWQDPVTYAQDLWKAFRYLQRIDMAASLYNFQLCTLPKSLWPFCRKSISDWKNGYIEECHQCSKINECGGFFTTSGEYRSEYIKSVKQ